MRTGVLVAIFQNGYPCTMCNWEYPTTVLHKQYPKNLRKTCYRKYVGLTTAIFNAKKHVENAFFYSPIPRRDESLRVEDERINKKAKILFNFEEKERDGERNGKHDFP